VAAGVAAAYLLGYEERLRETAMHRLLGNVCIFGTAALLLWAVFQAFTQLLQHAA
jgi:hypothetical protein